MKKPLQDERLIQETRKQNSLAFSILYFGLLLDLLYRQFILQQTISMYWDLALLFFAVTFFLAIKRVSSGSLSNRLISNILPSSIIAVTVFSAINYWWLGSTSALDLITDGILFIFAFVAVNLLMQHLSHKKNDAILKDD